MVIKPTYLFKEAVNYLMGYIYLKSKVNLSDSRSISTKIECLIVDLLKDAIDQGKISFTLSDKCNQYSKWNPLYSNDDIHTRYDKDSDSDRSYRLVKGMRPVPIVGDFEQVTLSHTDLVSWFNTNYPELLSKDVIEKLTLDLSPKEKHGLCNYHEIRDSKILELAKFCVKNYPDECVGVRGHYTADAIASCLIDHNLLLDEKGKILKTRKVMAALIGKYRKDIIPI